MNSSQQWTCCCTFVPAEVNSGHSSLLDTNQMTHLSFCVYFRHCMKRQFQYYRIPSRLKMPSSSNFKPFIEKKIFDNYSFILHKWWSDQPTISQNLEVFTMTACHTVHILMRQALQTMLITRLTLTTVYARRNHSCKSQHVIKFLTLKYHCTCGWHFWHWHSAKNCPGCSSSWATLPLTLTVSNTTTVRFITVLLKA